MQHRTLIFPAVFFIVSLAAFSRHLQGADWPAGFDVNNPAHRVPLAIVADFFHFQNHERQLRPQLIFGKLTNKLEIGRRRILFQNAAFRLVHRIGSYRGMARSPLRDDLLFIKAYCLYEIQALNSWEFGNSEYQYMMDTAYAIVTPPGFVARIKHRQLRLLFSALRRNIGAAYQNWISPQYDNRTQLCLPHQEERINRFFQVVETETRFLINALPQDLRMSRWGHLNIVNFYFHKLMEFNRYDVMINCGRRLLEVVRAGRLYPLLVQREAELHYLHILGFYGAVLFMRNQQTEFGRLQAYLTTLPAVKLGKQWGKEDYRMAVLFLTIAEYLREQRQTGKTPSPERQQRVRRAFAASFFTKRKKPVGHLETFLNALPKKEQEQITRILWPRE